MGSAWIDNLSLGSELGRADWIIFLLLVAEDTAH
jgi:hypothetical protein